MPWMICKSCDTRYYAPPSGMEDPCPKCQGKAKEQEPEKPFDANSVTFKAAP